MSFTIWTAWVSRNRWPKVFGSSLAVLLLTAVPAFGLIYTGNWIVKQNQQTGGAPHATINTSNPASLFVGMGVNSHKSSTSTVVVRRTFTVENLPGPTVPGDHHNSTRGETIQFTNQFATLIRDGLIQVIARIFPTFGADRFNDVFTRNIGRNTTTTVSKNSTNDLFLRPGRYTLEITIRYNNRQGFWDNQQSASGHRFTLTSI
jgi:hypothetical protein